MEEANQGRDVMLLRALRAPSEPRSKREREHRKLALKPDVREALKFILSSLEDILKISPYLLSDGI